MDFCDLFQCYVTLTFDLLTKKVDRFMPLLYRSLVLSKSVCLHLKYPIHKFGNGHYKKT